MSKLISSITGKQFALVIQRYQINGEIIEKEITVEQLIKVCEKLTYNYFVILHDKDVDENGEAKINHFHCVIELENKKSMSRVYKAFATLLDIKENCVSINDIWSLRKEVRYLIHLDDAKKHQYDWLEIKTNNVPMLRNYLNRSKDYQEQDLIDLCRQCKCLSSLIKRIGITYYEKHSRLIDNLLKEYENSSSEARYFKLKN